MEAVRTVEGEIDEMKERLSSTGDEVVELIIKAGGGMERCVAYAEKAKTLQTLHEKMKGLVSRNGVGHIRDLHVRIEVSGIVKNQAASKDIIVTGIKLAG